MKLKRSRKREGGVIYVTETLDEKEKHYVELRDLVREGGPVIT